MKKLICSLLLLSGLVYAENVEIHGTSTLHDWKMVSNETQTVFENDGSKITKLNVSVQIKTLKSGDSGLDEKAYETLKIDRNNVITFKLLEADLAAGTIKGVFKVLDKERTETLKPEVLTLDRVAGNFKVKMTEFGLEVPSVMFGAIKSGDEVTVKYDIKK
ncbi:MAG: YceI family protein [Sulfurospirillum sp.]|uniref:YceI family protein n=1 Tax=Sulfurospirillum sp. UCH001 TaxID=1581011 RepID=UPI00082F0E31|nr:MULTISPECIES: YceI family protein [unclassified Sulfurospirillum]WNY99868.1 YceI family protein [Sulfurospirillum sp. 'SP']